MDHEKAKSEEAGIYIEPYAEGFIIADYRTGARFRGKSNTWRNQPIVYDVFLTEAVAIEAAKKESKE